MTRSIDYRRINLWRFSVLRGGTKKTSKRKQKKRNADKGSHGSKCRLTGRCITLQ